MRRNLILVALSLMTWGLGEGMFFFFTPLYLQEQGANPVAIGSILGITGIAMIVAHLPAGYLSDRIGRRPLMIAAWVIGMVSTWIMALARTLPIFILGNALYGMTSFVIAPLNSYITAGRGKYSVGRAITLISASFNIGYTIGALVGGWVGQHAGLRTNYLVAACIFIFSSLTILFIQPQPIHPPQAGASQEGMHGLFNQRFIQYLIVVFIAMFSMYLPQPLSPNYLQNQRGIDLIQMGQLLALRSVGVVVLNLVIGQLNARLGFLLSQAAMALFTILLLRGTGFYWYALGYLLVGGYQTARSMASAQGRTLVNAANMGLAYGMIETVAALTIILAPPLAGFLYAQNPIWMYSVSLVLIGLAIVITMIFSPVSTRDLVIEDKEKPEWIQS